VATICQQRNEKNFIFNPPAYGRILNNVEVIQHPEQLVNSNGLTLNFDSFGDPQHPAIILIMGLGTQMIFWHDEFCKQIAVMGFWVVRFDNRDIGKSSWLNKAKTPGKLSTLSNVLFNRRLKTPYLLDDMADDTLGLMETLNIDSAHLVGASMGGMIAQCIALKMPSKVKTLTSIMSTTGNRSLPKPRPSVSIKLAARVPKSTEAYLNHALSLWRLIHGAHYPFNTEDVTQLLQQAFQRGTNPNGVIRQFCAIIASPDRTQALSNLNIPSLVVHGDMDPLVPVQCGIATANAIPNAKLCIFKGMGHTLPQSLWSDIINEISLLTTH
jgi:pimeloyl-ACP methyl ester carboxylesterase